MRGEPRGDLVAEFIRRLPCASNAICVGSGSTLQSFGEGSGAGATSTLATRCEAGAAPATGAGWSHYGVSNELTLALGVVHRSARCPAIQNFLSTFTTVSTPATWKRCWRPCTETSCGPTAWRAGMSTDTTAFATTGRDNGR